MLKSERVSESLRLGTILAFTGGFTDVYSYVVRGGVFANAETGNIVMMGVSLVEGNWGKVLHYLIPVMAFALGVFAAECIQKKMGEYPKIHWKEGVLWAEILCILAAGFIPQEGNDLVNSMIAFCCAMQVEAFRKVRGKAFATTMCTGNLRSGTELLAVSLFNRDFKKFLGGIHYYWIDLTFVFGAAAGAVVCRFLEEKAIWVCAVTLLCSLGFIRYHKRQLAV